MTRVLLILAALLLAACERNAPADLQAVVEAERQQLAAGCGIVIKRPRVILGDAGGHGKANCLRNEITLSEGAVRDDRAFVIQSLIPHEVAHLGHCQKYRTGEHPPEFWVIEEYLRGVTEGCGGTPGG